MDAEAGRGAVVLSNTARDTAGIALSLLDVEEDPGSPWWQARTAWVSLGLLVLGTAMAGRFVHRVVRGGTPTGDRADLVSALAEPLSMLLIAGAVGPWHRVSVLVWWAGMSVLGWATWLVATHWPSVHAVRRRSAIGWVLTGVGLSLNLLVLATYLWFAVAR